EMRLLLQDARTISATGAEPAAPIAPSAHRRSTLSKSFARFMTTTPPASPPNLVCPSCDQPLMYDYSHIGGVSALHAEQWDQYVCRACGVFQYRHRTRKLCRID